MWDLKYVAQTGMLRAGSRLHGILSMIGMHLKLDAGELESLNSQIKSTVGQATTAMSLELLSSRVTVRKSLTMDVHGRPTFRNLKQLAETIASRSTLYQGSESSLLADSDRWVPPSAVHISTCSPQRYDPSMRLTVSEQWGLKYNKLLMKALRHHQKENLPALALGVCFHYASHEVMYIVAELSGRTCQVQMMDPMNVTARTSAGIPKDNMSGTCEQLVNMRVGVDGVDGIVVENQPEELSIRQQLWQLPTNLSFSALVSVLGQQHDDVVEKNKCVHMFVADLAICTSQETLQSNRVRYKVSRAFYIAQLVKRKAYTKREKKPHTDDANMSSDDNESGFSEENDDIFDDEEQIDDEEHENIEREINGEDLEAFDDMMEELKDDELGRDLLDLDEINSNFVAAARSKQEEQLFVDPDEVSANGPDSLDDQAELERSFEDELGETLLQSFCNQRHERVPAERPHPVSTLSEDRVLAALDQWSRQMSRFCEACQLMVQGLDSFEPSNPDGCLSRDVSLLVHETDTCDNVSLVTWVKPYKALSGRVVSVDDTASLIYPSHFLPKRSFHNSIMVLPHCGVRIKKQERDVVPDIYLYLQKLFSIGLATLACSALGSDNRELANCVYDDASGCSVCVACGHGETHGLMRQCAACLQWWHCQCSDKSASFVASYVATREVAMLKDYDVCANDLPFLLLSVT